jgi:hypothetical protein
MKSPGAVVVLAALAGACRRPAPPPPPIDDRETTAAPGDAARTDGGPLPAADADVAWAREVRAVLRAMDLRRWARTGGIDPACLCRDACALALPAPPAGPRTIDWSDSLRLEVSPGGAVLRCEARASAGAPWSAHPCPGGSP